jgi:hypothetical protein
MMGNILDLHNVKYLICSHKYRTRLTPAVHRMQGTLLDWLMRSVRLGDEARACTNCVLLGYAFYPNSYCWLICNTTAGIQAWLAGVRHFSCVWTLPQM